MSDKDATLEQQLAGKVNINRELCGLIVARTEPYRVLQGIKWDLTMMRAEMTALRQMLEAKGGFDKVAYQKRFADVLDTYNGLMQEQLSVVVMENGQIIEGAKSQKLWKS
jgi:hypothetical protein